MVCNIILTGISLVRILMEILRRFYKGKIFGRGFWRMTLITADFLFGETKLF